MSKYDTIVEVGKNVDQITEVEKFNPFHDSRGRFASSSGFKSYSANPNTKAGAMAISRSAAAGHMNTVNVHREAQATGTTIRQNANWLGQGKQQTRGQTGSATLNRRVEPARGLAGASATGASWQAQNQQQGRTTKPGKQTPTKQQPQQTQQQQTKPTAQKPAAQKPAQSNPKNQNGNLAQDVSGVTVSGRDKLAIVPRNSSGQSAKTTKVADDNYQSKVAGKDISKSFDNRKISGRKSAIDNVAEQQGWNKPATVTNDLETFQKAALKSGRVMYRAVDGTGRETANQICKKTMTDGNASLGGNGGKVYGGGMYLTDCKITSSSTGRSQNASRLAQSSGESFAYANTQMMATVHPDAKIATPTQANQMKRAFQSLPSTTRAKFGHDVGAYIASKGYDGAKWHNDSDPAAYTTMYNKSAMIFYGGTSQGY